MTLTHDTPAVQIHGLTDQEVVYATLPAGTAYEDPTPGAFGWDGRPNSLITVDGYLYRVATSDLSAD